ncbi:MarR family winged helix-turn-helix transcriptional regulator [Secundilactobacillus folii]|uniref:MarR family transcriptional regulator n=1 Tax=Secundilactobacillus folii TaxID=2678357 RepID=A0A7X2XV32_9LACO|nr:MarR family transcriptional regulator [Secundilactobacillus folii]MTV81493.1 MarR family transcriptional regulator [Secundilactobacillus folii]
MVNLGYLLMDQTKVLKSQLKHALEKQQLTVTQWAVIAALARADGPKTAAQLAQELEMDKPTVSGVVRRLLKKKLIQEHPKPADKRAREILLTELGSSTYQQCAKIADQTIAHFLSPLSPEQQQQLSAILTILEGEQNHDENISPR